MSQLSPLNIYVQARFQDTFGPPHNSLGHDWHWQFQPSPAAQPINVLVNGTLEYSAVWIFDSNVPHDGVVTATISHKDHVDGALEKIHERIKRAGG